jgi:very-short-patch-repair endonuclease
MDSERIRLVVPGEIKQKALEAARTFRKNPTPSEAILWQTLRGKKLDGIKFRRQQPIGPFIVDFYAPALRLVVEVDGVVHEQQQEADQARQDILESLDLQFLRFSATQVESDIDSVLLTIRLKAKEIKNLSSCPSPTSGEGRVPLPRLSGKGLGDEVHRHE